MIPHVLNILLADDDQGDCLLFKDALEELPVNAQLTTVHNGEEVLEILGAEGQTLPDVLFLDLNMPRKNGYASLGSIKRNSRMQQIPVIIFSTTSDDESVKRVFKDAAHYYICKPSDFSQLKKVIYEALTLVTQVNKPLPLEKDFLITGNSVLIPENRMN